MALESRLDGPSGGVPFWLSRTGSIGQASLSFAWGTSTRTSLPQCPHDEHLPSDRIKQRDLEISLTFLGSILSTSPSSRSRDAPRLGSEPRVRRETIGATVVGSGRPNEETRRATRRSQPLRHSSAGGSGSRVARRCAAGADLRRVDRGHRRSPRRAWACLRQSRDAKGDYHAFVPRPGRIERSSGRVGLHVSPALGTDVRVLKLPEYPP
jgi:hypothetical protein